jgi:hypothetical protein
LQSRCDDSGGSPQVVVIVVVLVFFFCTIRRYFAVDITADVKPRHLQISVSRHAPQTQGGTTATMTDDELSSSQRARLEADILLATRLAQEDGSHCHRHCARLCFLFAHPDHTVLAGVEQAVVAKDVFSGTTKAVAGERAGFFREIFFCT